jgi:hypothetical protein
MGEMAEDLKSLKWNTVRDITSNLTDFREG